MLFSLALRLLRRDEALSYYRLEWQWKLNEYRALWRSIKQFFLALSEGWTKSWPTKCLPQLPDLGAIPKSRRRRAIRYETSPTYSHSLLRDSPAPLFPERLPWHPNSPLPSTVVRSASKSPSYNKQILFSSMFPCSQPTTLFRSFDVQVWILLTVRRIPLRQKIRLRIDHEPLIRIKKLIHWISAVLKFSH